MCWESVDSGVVRIYMNYKNERFSPKKIMKDFQETSSEHVCSGKIIFHNVFMCTSNKC